MFIVEAEWLGDEALSDDDLIDLAEVGGVAVGQAGETTAKLTLSVYDAYDAVEAAREAKERIAAATLPAGRIVGLVVTETSAWDAAEESAFPAREPA